MSSPSPNFHYRERQIKVNAITQAQLIKLMLEGDHNCQELAEETGLHYVTVCQYARELHRIGAAHIVRWDEDRNGRRNIRVYKLGVGKDVKAQRMTVAERQTRYRHKKRMAAQLGLIGAKVVPVLEQEPA